MSLSSIFTTAADTDRLKEFVKSPENKEWLGRVSRFYNKLEAEPVIDNHARLMTVAEELKCIADDAILLLRAALAGGDVGDGAMLDRFCGALSAMFKGRLSPEMAAAAEKGVQ